MTEQAAPSERESQEQPGFWTHLQEVASLANYCPRPAEGVVSREQDDHYVLKAPRSDSYLRLSLDEYTLWTWMDGQRSVRQLAVDFFLRQHRLIPAAELVRRLRAGGLLADPATGLRAQLQEAARRQEEPWGRRLLGLLWGHPLTIPGMDRFFRQLYRFGGRLLLARPAALLQRLVAVAGFVAFVALLAQGRAGYEVFQADRSYLLGFLLLLVLNILTLGLHECAHALATIHEGCEIRRGGFMLYLGLPTLFVDTTDTWMVGRVGRIRVAAAGPWNDLVLGGLCSLLAFPVWAGGPVLLKVAVLAYVSALFNLNPLAEMDGYYVLSDALGLPHLRRDALAFVEKELWPRLRRRLPFSPRERLYAAYGLLAVVYVVLLAGLVFLFWRTQVAHLVADLLRWGPWGRVLLGMLVALFVLPVVWLVGRRLYLSSRRAWLSLAERGLLGRAVVRLLLVAGASVALALLLLLLPAGSPRAVLYFPLLLFYALSLAALLGVLPHYQQAPFRRVLIGLAVILALRGVLVSWEEVGRTALLLSQVGLFAVGLAAFTVEDLARSRPSERVAMGVFLAGGFVLALDLALRISPGGSLLTSLGQAGPVFLGGLGLAMLLPTVVSFADTPFAPSWVLVFLALTLNLGRCAFVATLPLALELDLVTAWLLAQGTALYLLAQRYARCQPSEGADVRASGGHARLRQGFAHFFAALFRGFRDTFGRRRALVLDDRLDVIAVTADWPVAVDAGLVQEIAQVEDWPLEQLAAQYTELLESALDIMDNLAGRPWLRRAIQSAYDSLPWTEREVLSQHVLARTAWGEAVSRGFSQEQAELSLLAGVPLLWGCDEDTLAQLWGGLRRERVRAGQVLARPGEKGEDLWVVVSGEVEVWQADEAGRDRLVGELHRRDSFGEAALLGEPYPALYRTSVDTTLLRLKGAAFRGVWQDRPSPSPQMQERARLFSWLVGLDLFRGLPWRDLRALSARMERRRVPAWEAVIMEGQPIESFDLIEQGRVLTVSGWGTAKEEILGEVGPGQHLGGPATLLGREASVTVLTIEPCILWALPVDEFQWFLERSLAGGQQ